MKYCQLLLHNVELYAYMAVHKSIQINIDLLLKRYVTDPFYRVLPVGEASDASGSSRPKTPIGLVRPLDGTLPAKSM
jgi:hypothetical protein